MSQPNYYPGQNPSGWNQQNNFGNQNTAPSNPFFNNPGGNNNNNFNDQIGRMGMQMGVNYLQSQFEQRFKQTPSISDYIFTDNIRRYFDVDNSYVLKKLFKIVVPFLKSKEEDYSQPSGWNDADYGMTKTEEHHHRTLLSPDLYIPLMSFMTFILMVCLSMGYRNEFRPELISNYTINCMFFAILEMLLYKLILLIVRVKTLSLLDIIAFLNYKFVGLCLVLLAKFLIGGWITTGITVYFSISFVYYMYAELRSHAEGVAEGIDIGNFSLPLYFQKYGLDSVLFLDLIRV
jgi:hypothetical protein